MVCGGFSCSKNALAALNVLYILVAFILIGTAAYGKAVAIITSLTIMGGIIACGVFLLIIAIIGLIGAIRHHQVLLFFYMIILFLLFLIQFAIACACLAINTEQQKRLATTGWKKASEQLKNKVQKTLNCCGFENQDLLLSDPSGMGHPACEALECCTKDNNSAPCCTGLKPNSTVSTTVPCPCTETTSGGTCWNVIGQYMDQALKLAGGIGLFFSFTEITGVWLTVKFRNLKDPRANPSAFL